MVNTRCFRCGDESNADPDTPCGRDLSEERGQEPGSAICGGRYEIVRCERCWLPIEPGRAIRLELSQYTGKYQPQGAPLLPAEESQGYFEFGPECAKKPNARISEAARERNLMRRS